MLRCVLGRAGSGKTEWVLKTIASAIAAGQESLVFLVPEQFSFETERILLERFGAEGAAKVEVLSFTRLADRVFRETGGIAMPVMDDVTRALIMSRALELHIAPENRGETAVSVRLNDTAYVSSLLALATECKQCAVTPNLLAAVANGLPDGTLKNKASDFAKLFDIYEGLSLTSGMDPEDVLRILLEKLPLSERFMHATVFVDGFKGFTALEREILGILMQKGDVTVTLPVDKAAPEADAVISGLFAPAMRSLQQLRQTAAEHGAVVEEPLLLTENHRAKNEELRVLEAGCFIPAAGTEEAITVPPTDKVTVTACSDVYAECAAAARSIRRLLREQAYRAGEIAVVVRHSDGYRGILDRALQREEVPFYMDMPADVYTAPLVSLCLSALRIAAGGMQTEELLRMCKSGILSFDETETALLENYVYMWRIDGKRWRSPFTANPSGLTEWKKSDHIVLDRLEGLRRRLIAPLEQLHAALADKADGATFGKALYAYLTHPEVCADEGVRRLYAALNEEGEPFAAECTARLWDSVMTLLDRFASVFADALLPARRYADLFHLAAGLLRLPSVPQGLDVVQVGSADHMRLRSPKAVYILGANEGVFPAYPAEGNFFTDSEREQLEQGQLHLAAGRLQKAEEERFFAYTAIAAPSERLYVSYVNFGGGEKLLPSAIVENIQRLVPNYTRGVCEAADGSDIESAADAVARLAVTPDRQYAASLTASVACLPESAALLERMEQAQRPPQFTLSPETAGQLFGRELWISSSQIDAFHECPFSYFCNYGMKLQTRRLADVDHRIFGNFAHYVLEHLLPVYVREKITPTPADIPMMQKRIHDTLMQYVEEKLGGFEDKPARFRYLLSLVENTAFSLLWFVVNEMAQSEFSPVDYELGIGDGENCIPSPTITLPDEKGVIHIIGKVDRVDLYRRESDGKVFVRVVDYKTGQKTFSLNNLPYGLNMQMLVYLFAVCAAPPAHYECTEASPAGVLYLTSDKAPHMPLSEKKLKALRMNGLLIRDAGVIAAMEEDGKGTFIPAAIKGGTVTDTSSVVSGQDFETIRRFTTDLLVEMANRLLSGDVPAMPTGDEKKLPCRYCQYKTICRRKEEDPANYVEKRDPAAVLELMGEVSNDGVDESAGTMH